MLEREHIFRVRADAQAVRRLLSDLMRIYYLFPVFTRAEAASHGVRWYLEEGFQRRLGSDHLTARILSRTPHTVSLEAVAPDLSVKASFTWGSVEDGAEIRCRFALRAGGFRGRIIESVMAAQLPDLLKYFETRAREVLEQTPWVDGVGDE